MPQIKSRALGAVLVGMGSVCVSVCLAGGGCVPTPQSSNICWCQASKRGPCLRLEKADHPRAELYVPMTWLVVLIYAGNIGTYSNSKYQQLTCQVC